MNPDREALITILAVISMSGLLLSILMMTATTVYLNKSPDRFRIFELGYSKESKWFKTGKVDFFTANYVMAAMPIAAIKLKRRNSKGLSLKQGIPLAPYLHISNNYEKLPQECPFFFKWAIAQFCALILTIALLFVGYGMDANWW
jgi:hypothetical protein